MTDIVIAAPAADSSRDYPFDQILRVREDGSEYWSARDLMEPLGYDRWENFARPVKEARRAATIVAAQDHFRDSTKMVPLGSGAERGVADVEMTRYGAYMVAMSCDGRKPEVAAAKTYFAVQTRRAELGIVEPVQPQISYTGVKRVDGALADAALLHAMKGLVHTDHLEARARIVLARGLGETPQLEASTRPIYASDFVAEQGLSSKDLKQVPSQFGKKAKAAYILEHGTEPAIYPQNLPNGQVREVCAYTVADRPLLEKVWREHFASKYAPAS